MNLPTVMSIIAGLAIGIPFVLAMWKEYLCISSNPFPLFGGTDKRFKEVEKVKTRSIAKDIC